MPRGSAPLPVVGLARSSRPTQRHGSPHADADDVGRLDIAMDQALAMQMAECGGQRGGDVQTFGHGQAAAPPHFGGESPRWVTVRRNRLAAFQVISQSQQTDDMLRSFRWRRARARLESLAGAPPLRRWFIVWSRYSTIRTGWFPSFKASRPAIRPSFRRAPALSMIRLRSPTGPEPRAGAGAARGGWTCSRPVPCDSVRP